MSQSKEEEEWRRNRFLIIIIQYIIGAGADVASCSKGRGDAGTKSLEKKN